MRWRTQPSTKVAERCICGKKISSYAQAKKEAKYIKYNKKYSDMMPVPYKCRQSGRWHVGNTTT